jgi:hypothetical protein
VARDGILPNAMELKPRLHRAKPQDLSAVGVFEVSFPWEASTFLFRVQGGNPAADSIKVGIARQDDSANPVLPPTLDAITEVIDPLDFPVVLVNPGTRKLYVFVLAAQAGMFLDTTALAGIASPGFTRVLNPLTVTQITQPVTQARVTMTWGAPALTAVGAASTTILNLNALRVAYVIQNTGPGNVAIRFAAAAAVLASDIILAPGDAWNEPAPGRLVYTGEIRAISGGAGNEVRVMEAT